MVTLFVSDIRLILEYCSTVVDIWVVLRSLRMFNGCGLGKLRVWKVQIISYLARLRKLIHSIYGRMSRTDLIKVWKIFHAEVDVGLASIFEKNSNVATRGHSFKRFIPRCHSEIGRRFFNVTSVQVWNNLPVESFSFPIFQEVSGRELGTFVFRTGGGFIIADQFWVCLGLIFYCLVIFFLLFLFGQLCFERY